jgi:glycosyltransferase involved in cell wall biosynthesis
MKRIVFFLHAGLGKPGGAERVLTIIANELSRLNYHVSIMSYSLEDKSYYPLSDKVHRIPLGYNISKSTFINTFLFFKIIFKLRKQVKINKTDIIIPLGTESAIITILSLFFLPRVKKMVWIHYSFFQKLKLRDRLFRRIFIKYFDKLLVLNKTDFKKFNDLFPNKVEYLPNPVSFKSNEFSTLNNKVFIAAGRIDKIKGFDQLIKSFNIVVNEYGHKDWRLRIFGKDGGEKSNLKILIENLKLTSNVFIFDAVNNIKQEYLLSDVYLMTSINECFPMVLLEAQAIGLPIISFDCNSGPRDIIENNINGFLIDPYNIHSFASAMSLLINDFELRAFMGRNAKQSVKQFYLENIIIKWQNIL